VLWATIYDTEYAMVDRDDDLRIGIKSTAILFGEGDRLIIGLLQVLMTAALLLIGARAGLGPAYYGAVAIATLLFLWQQWLIRERDRDGCFRAFLNNNVYGGIVFVGIVLDYMYR
jgi:4-hydroxybenzoate polyprenyltransferase